jgi:hypothetical protein
MLGQAAYDRPHVCYMCQGKAAKRLFRQITKRQRAREKRAWTREL